MSPFFNWNNNQIPMRKILLYKDQIFTVIALFILGSCLPNFANATLSENVSYNKAISEFKSLASPNDATVSGYVFIDEDGDCIMDEDEFGVEGIEITLLGADGFKIVTTCDAYGHYIFESLSAGLYSVSIGDGPIDAELVSIGIVPVSIEGGEDYTELNFCYVTETEVAEINGQVFEDLNCNGIQDAGENGLANIVVYLYDEFGNIDELVFSDEDGYYIFPNLIAGDYSVEVGVGPDNYEICGTTAHTIVLESGETNVENNFGFAPEANSGTISCYVFVDLNGDCIKDDNEIGLIGIECSLYGPAGLKGTLLTDDNGFCQFGNLDGSVYSVQLGEFSDEYILVSLGVVPITIENGENYDGIYFCLIEAEETSSISGNVSEDADCDGITDGGIEGVVVYLYDEYGNIVTTLNTDENGDYYFGDLEPGDYSVQVGNGPVDYFNCNGNITDVDLPGGTNIENVDFTFGTNEELGGINGYVQIDPNGNCGYGSAGLEGIEVSLVSPDGSKTIVWTDENGQFTFYNLEPGAYSVDVGVAPDGYSLSGESIIMIVLEEGEYYSGIHFCFYPNLELGSIGDYVWIDLNSDGIQDSGEPGLEGITVFLYDENNNIISVTTTDADGYYIFDNLPAGEYTSVIGYGPIDYILTTNEAYEITLGAGENYEAADFGFVPPVELCPNPIDCDDMTTCTEALTSVEVCLDSCGSDVEEYISAYSYYNCGVQILPNNCLVYTPIQGMEFIGYDYIHIQYIGTDGECYSLTVNVSIGNCEGEPCEASAGDLDPLNNSICTSDLAVAVVTEIPVIPDGFEITYLLVNDENGSIEAFSDSPVFDGLSIGTYFIHTLIYDGFNPADYSNPSDIFELLQQGGGELCGSLLINGAQIIVEECTTPCQADAGGLTCSGQEFCHGDEIYGSTNGYPVIPQAYSLVYLWLNADTGEIIEITNNPQTQIHLPGSYSVHSLVYNTDDLDLNAFDSLNDLLYAFSDGEFCYDLLVNGPAFTVIDCMEDCENDPIYECTGPMEAVIICPEFCAFESGYPYEISDLHSTYECGLQILDDGCVKYTPLPMFEGDETITIVACSGSVCDTVLVHMTVGDCTENNPPIAIDDNTNTNQGTSVSINILNNDSDPDNDPIYICNVPEDAQASNGTVVFTSTGFIYTPDSDFVGTDTFTYTICDGNGGTDQATVTIVVLPNDCDSDMVLCVPPFLENQTPTEICVDFCIAGPVEITSIISMYQCSIDHNNGNLCFDFTPLPAFLGDNIISVTGCNASGDCETAEVLVEVGNCGINNPPLAVDDNATTNNDGFVSIPAIDNDSDPDGDNIYYCNTASDLMVAHGSITLSADGFDYQAENGFYGTDSFTYTICDGNGESSTATVYITVPQDDCDPNQSICVLPFLDSQNSTTVCVDFCLYGVNEISDINSIYNCSISNQNGLCFDFLPLPSFTGNNLITVTGCNNNGECESAEISVYVGQCDEENNPPVAVDDSQNTNDSGFADIYVLNNDSDPDGDQVYICNSFGDASPANGTVTLTAYGFQYQANDGFEGTDSFTYTICDGNGSSDQATVYVTVTAAPCEPNQNICVAPFNTSQTSTEICIDFCGNGMTIEDISSNFTCGIEQHGNTCFDYTPLPLFEGENEIAVTGCNSSGDCETVMIYVNVTNDCGGTNEGPVAVNDDAQTTYNAAVTISVLNNDYDPDGGSISFCNHTGDLSPTSGSAYVSGNNIVYTPTDGFTGYDSFTYTICDSNGAYSSATVTIYVGGDNTNPVAVDDHVSTTEGSPVNIFILFNDYDNDGDFLSICPQNISAANNGTVVYDGTMFIYTPNSGFSGMDSFNYSVCDGNGGSATATVHITVEGGTNYPPIGVNDYVETGVDIAVTIDVLSNDGDFDNDPLTLCGFNNGVNGTVSQNGSQLVYTPNGGFVGNDSFTYSLCDGNGGTDIATVYVTVDGISTNTAPVALNDNKSCECNGVIQIPVLFNDYDPDGDAISICGFDQPSNGTVLQVEDQLFYTPNQDFGGADQFNYTVCDNNGLSSTGIVFLTVNCGNNSIVANNDYGTTADNQTLYLSILNNDVYPADCTPSIEVLTPSDSYNGAVLIAGDGQLIYVPQLGGPGTIVLQYEICCGDYCDQATVYIDVTAHGECTIDGFRIPDVFTPNNDGLNESFVSSELNEYLDANQLDSDLSIFDINGQLIFQSHGVGSLPGWTGLIGENGMEAPQGTYIYVIQVLNNDRLEHIEGTIDLRR